MRSQKKLSWIGYFCTGPKEAFFQNLRMYEKPPGPTQPIGIEKKEGEECADDFKVTQVRECDLIVMTEEPLNLKGQDDIKRVSDVNFLRSLLFKHNAMFGFVTKKASKVGNSFAQV